MQARVLDGAVALVAVEVALANSMKARGCGLAKRLPVACTALAMVLTLPGCGALPAVGGAVHSTAEAIATVVKDAMAAEGNADPSREATETPE